MEALATIQSDVTCPLCSGHDLAPSWLVNGYSIAKCCACALVFVRNQVTMEELSAYYASFEDDSYGESNVECLNSYYHELGALIQKTLSRNRENFWTWGVHAVGF